MDTQYNTFLLAKVNVREKDLQGKKRREYLLENERGERERERVKERERERVKEREKEREKERKKEKE
jgi:hypothetical protein